VSAAAPAATGLFLEGLRCAGCAHRVERALRGAPGVGEATVNYTTHRAFVHFDPARTSPEALRQAVVALGYDATPYDPASLERPSREAARSALTRLLVAAFLAGNVMLVAGALYIGAASDLDPATRRGLRWLALGLSLPAATWCAWPFWSGALAGLRRREITMDVPIVLGIATAFGASLAGTLLEADHLFIDSAAMIVFLILLGRTLERSARSRAASAVERLSALAPREVLRRAADGKLERVDPASLAPGDVVVVPPGETVPTDGRVRGAAVELDESLLTGESVPVVRAPGEAVAAGTRNTATELCMEVTARVGEGTLARLVALLERAQAERPRVQQTADRVAAVFAPGVVAIALATAAGWWWSGAGALDTALAAAAVLIVACPCALGLATPAAVTAAIGRAAGLGIVVKSGRALERCADVDTVLFDKTGTLSEGRLAVEAVATAAGTSAAEVLALAARAEGAATHPVARALRDAAGEAADGEGDAAFEPLEPRRSRPGLGVEAGSGPQCVRVGTRRLLAEADVAPDAALEARARALRERGLTLAWVARGPHALGAVGLSDAARPDAADAVASLRRAGLHVELLSGDHAAAVARAAAGAGIAVWTADATPEEKVEAVRKARAAGRRVLVVGDGINDAAALAAADVGIAMARGADVAVHAADLVVRAQRLGAVADGLALSRATLRRIRENLGFALAYNAVAIPLAVAGVLTPLHAALAMSASSLVVTGNAVRLLRWRAGAR